MAEMNRLHLSLLGIGLALGQLSGCSNNSTSTPEVVAAPIATPQSAEFAAACGAIASIAAQLPVPNTQITAAKFVAAGTATANSVALPDHCQVTGIIGARTGFTGPTGTAPYGTHFELRLPARTAWNGRFMYQGGGGTQGSVPAATGTAGTASPTLAAGWAVASDDGGHENSEINIPANAGLLSGAGFYSDPQAVKDWAYGAADVTTRTSKAIIAQLYSKAPDRSYFVGCSTSGRQGMAMSQLFPEYYDGIVAGDPFFLPPAISLSEINGVQAFKAVSPIDPTTGKPQYYNSFTTADTALFTKAVLQACDAFDGLVDGVIDNTAACNDPVTGFDPGTFVFTDTNLPLQCTGAKTASCLSAAQVSTMKQVQRGPRTSTNQQVFLDGQAISGYPWDGGLMAASGIPSRDIGTATTLPGNLTLGAAQLPLLWYTVPEITFDPTLFNWDTDIGKVTTATNSPAVNSSTDLGIFKNRGAKILFYHGQSDGGPPITYTINYYKALANRYGGIPATQAFAKLYTVPNMGHCSGGPSTDQFDFLTPLVAWVEKGSAPDTITASGTNFTSAPTTRSRPLCAYPKAARYTGVVPATAASIALAASYSCI